MSNRVLCLRPEDDFLRVGAAAPASLAVTYRAPADPDVAALFKSSDALVIPAVGPKLAAELFEGTKLKLAQVTGSGVDRFDQAALTRLGIPVANVAGGSNSAVAEICRHHRVDAAAALRLVRRRDQGRQLHQVPRAHDRRQSLRHRRPAGGIDRLRHHRPRSGAGVPALGAKVCFYDPAPVDAAAAAALDARAVSFDELLATWDVVSLHVPLIPATQNLIGAKELARMKPGAILIQASRGGIVDEAALAASLTSGSSRRRGGGCLLHRAAAGRQSAAEGFRRSRVTVADDAAYRRHHAAVTAILFRSSWQNVERVLLRNEPPVSRVYRAY